jgi:hypothetical protein
MLTPVGIGFQVAAAANRIRRGGVIAIALPQTI